jgi:hypothetical protein
MAGAGARLVPAGRAGPPAEREHDYIARTHVFSRVCVLVYTILVHVYQSILFDLRQACIPTVSRYGMCPGSSASRSDPSNARPFSQCPGCRGRVCRIHGKIQFSVVTQTPGLGYHSTFQDIPLVGDGHGARRAGADDPPGCHQGSVADPDREDEG